MMSKKSTKEKNYVFPPVSLLDYSEIDMNQHVEEDDEKAARFESVLAQYGTSVKVLKVDSGLRVTRYEFMPTNGTRIEDPK